MYHICVKPKEVFLKMIWPLVFISKYWTMSDCNETLFLFISWFQITANLIISKLYVNKQHVCSLPMNTPVMVENVEVTLLEANQWVFIICHKNLLPTLDYSYTNYFSHVRFLTLFPVPYFCSCPGAVLFIFKLPKGQVVLHTGEYISTHSLHKDKILEVLGLIFGRSVLLPYLISVQQQQQQQ